MLSYQHAYHAGNPADLHKHLALAQLIQLLTVKARGISYLETHAGRGLYDLGSEEARKTGEASEGIGRARLPADAPLASVLGGLRREYGEGAYPGSPMIAARLLRPQDRIVLMERHPEEYRALKRAMRGTPAQIHHRDGYEGARALTPLQPRRGLVLIDPSYEVKTDYTETGRLAMDLSRRWPEAAIVVWYPLLAAERHTILLQSCAAAAPLVDETRFDLKDGKGMTGSGLVILGAPYGAEDALSAAFSAGSGVLRRPHRA